MTTQMKFIALISLCLFLIVSCLWLSSDLDKANNRIKALNIEIGNIREKSYNDSVLVSEYQEALEEYIYLDPKAADEFMRIIEKINTK